MVDKKRGRPKKSEQVLDEPNKKAIDEPITEIKFNEEAVVTWAHDEIQAMIDDRQEWHSKRMRYINEFEDLVRDNKSGGSGVWEGAADFHVPLTMWMIKQTHARIMQAMIGDGFGFVTRPQEKMDVKRAEQVDRLMKWAVKSYVNDWKGYDLTIDDWVWDTVKEGWGVIRAGWRVKEQKVILTPEDMDTLNESRTVEEVLTTAAQIVKTFDGPTIETIDHESILFPGSMQDPSDLNEPPLVAELVQLTRCQIEDKVRDGDWPRDKADKILEGPQRSGGSSNKEYEDAQRLKHSAQGTLSKLDSNSDEDVYQVYRCYARYNVDGDDFDEDVVFWYSDLARVIPQWTTLDRISPTTLKRPLFKADFIKRPRRAYSIGLAELLFSMNREVDAMHNQRIDFGTLASIPFFFFKPTSGMKKERIPIQPGVGIPLSNPQTDVNFPRFGGNVMFTRAEEAGVIGYAERLSSLPPMTAGQVSSPAGATGHATGFAGLLNQVGIDFDVVLNRFKSPFSQYLNHLHNDLKVKMPDGYQFRLLGSDGEALISEDGMVEEEITNRIGIRGNFDFMVTATSKSMNRESEAQSALVTAQTLLNPINIQSGLVQPQNIYEIQKEVLKSRGILGVERFITKPESVEKPISLLNEIVVLTQGEMPKLVMQDDHDSKIAGLTNYMNSEVFLANLQGRVIAGNAPELFDRAIRKHQDMLDSISSQANPSNVTGLQTSPTLGARLSGELNQQTGRSLAEQELLDASGPQQPNPFGTENLG